MECDGKRTENEAGGRRGVVGRGEGVGRPGGWQFWEQQKEKERIRQAAQTLGC